MDYGVAARKRLNVIEMKCLRSNFVWSNADRSSEKEEERRITYIMREMAGQAEWKNNQYIIV